MLGIAFSLLRNYGVFGSASKILAAASHGVAQLADSTGGGAGRAGGGGGGGTPAGPHVGNVGDGVLEGGLALARNLVQVGVREP